MWWIKKYEILNVVSSQIYKYLYSIGCATTKNKSDFASQENWWTSSVLYKLKVLSIFYLMLVSQISFNFFSIVLKHSYLF